ncbi:hypothetical protein MAPG_10642 [Magnaporthiopsis poae ATCC 64411]|uniref:Uncharacterized protein n=1 Tax=Magnaporthiopsis poae (strain ATCC 64411 / 73-15) TaxID=644358 RepID=A0A0C4ED49_MAGP6|nr:hypothetical protein MAPG_10642 [Magnaporthiopsis poae ATCC 64411]
MADGRTLTLRFAQPLSEPDDQKPDDQKLNDQKLNDQKLNDQKLNDQKLNDQKLNDQKLNDQKLNDQEKVAILKAALDDIEISIVTHVAECTATVPEKTRRWLDSQIGCLQDLTWIGSVSAISNLDRWLKVGPRRIFKYTALTHSASSTEFAVMKLPKTKDGHKGYVAAVALMRTAWPSPIVIVVPERGSNDIEILRGDQIETESDSESTQDEKTTIHRYPFCYDDDLFLPKMLFIMYLLTHPQPKPVLSNEMGSFRLVELPSSVEGPEAIVTGPSPHTCT